MKEMKQLSKDTMWDDHLPDHFDKKQIDEYLDASISKLNQLCQIIKNNDKVRQILKQVKGLTLQKFEKQYEQMITYLTQFKPNAHKNLYQEINAFAISKFVLSYLQSQQIKKLDNVQLAIFLLDIQNKLGSLPYLKYEKCHPDITNSPRGDYSYIWDKIVIQRVNNKSKLKEDYQALQKLIYAAVATLLEQCQTDFIFFKKIGFGFSFTKYLMMPDSARLNSFQFYRNPSLDMIQRLWNIPDKGATKFFSKILTEAVPTNIMIYIPTGPFKVSKPNIFEPFAEGCIPVRLLYKYNLDLVDAEEKGYCCSSAVHNESKIHQKIIIHIHGGGFVALSSSTMQSFTIRWANELKVPIFSIDYRMPPDYKFPNAVNDCFIAYQFIITQISKYFNINPKKVVIAGESAGGNLGCALVGKILQEKQLIPKGLYLSYPSTTLERTFSISRLKSLKDPILSPNLLIKCLQSYLESDKDAESPFASPLHLTESFISKSQIEKVDVFPYGWPKTIITVGLEDPLLDDSLLLMEKMVHSSIDCRCICYEGLYHGYLSTEKIVQQCQKTIIDSISHLRQLLGLKKKK